eukprot:SAG11_NODE_729_length_7489_cov_17.662246_2_plen_95_part_00
MKATILEAEKVREVERVDDVEVFFYFWIRRYTSTYLYSGTDHHARTMNSSTNTSAPPIYTHSLTCINCNGLLFQIFQFIILCRKNIAKIFVIGK